MKIYTKQGDQGSTALFSGRRISKDDQILEAYGTLDELNAFIGLCISKVQYPDIAEDLNRVQHTLFNIGSMLASDGALLSSNVLLSPGDTVYLESAIDKYSEELPPLKNFLLPSGSELIALGHVCRTITRRAERQINQLANSTEIEPHILSYINRLSDYFFVVTRVFARRAGIKESIWQTK